MKPEVQMGVLEYLNVKKVNCVLIFCPADVYVAVSFAYMKCTFLKSPL